MTAQAGNLPPPTRRCSRNAAAGCALTRVRRDVAPSGFSTVDSPALDYRTARLTLIRVFHVCRHVLRGREKIELHRSGCSLC